MRILVIGGTEFAGRHAVEVSVARGHEVTVFHRGEHEPRGFPDVEHLHASRDGGLDLLKGRTWDAALDTCGFVPRVVRKSVQMLSDSVEHYAFVSSLSVHPDELPPSANEGSPVHEPPFPETEEINEDSYGPLKVACEREAAAAFPGRCLVVRPGYIVGPHDPTDRFTYWVRRASEGGAMLAPGSPGDALQVVDARDLAGFTIDHIERRTDGVFGVVGPAGSLTFGGFLDSCVRAGGADTALTWVGQDYLRDLGGDVYELCPLWHPWLPGAHTYDMSRAVRAGLRHRAIDETVSDTLAWDRDRGRPEPMKAGLTRERERELLAGWANLR